MEDEKKRDGRQLSKEWYSRNRSYRITTGCLLHPFLDINGGFIQAFAKYNVYYHEDLRNDERAVKEGVLDGPRLRLGNA